MKYYLMMILLLLPSLLMADVYMQKDENGTTVYSDSAMGSSSQLIKVDEPSQISSTTAASNKNGATSQANTSQSTAFLPQQEDTDRKPYTTFEIDSPKDQSTEPNQYSFSVKFNVDPALQKGDVIQLYVDSAKFQTASASTTFSISLSRGTHYLNGEILSQDGTVLKTSPTVTVYVVLSHLGNPAVQTTPYNPDAAQPTPTQPVQPFNYYNPSTPQPTPTPPYPKDKLY